jgi:hypothetical protein
MIAMQADLMGECRLFSTGLKGIKNRYAQKAINAPCSRNGIAVSDFDMLA